EAGQQGRERFQGLGSIRDQRGVPLFGRKAQPILLERTVEMNETEGSWQRTRRGRRLVVSESRHGAHGAVSREDRAVASQADQLISSAAAAWLLGCVLRRPAIVFQRIGQLEGFRVVFADAGPEDDYDLR